MNFLILSCNTGEGHNSAAHAIREYFELKGDFAEVKDALSFWSDTNSKIISKGHVFIYRRLPKLFGIGYRFEENHPPKDDENSIMYELVKHGCSALGKALNESSYDAVICTHVFAGMMLTELRLQGKLKLPTYLVSTDYTCAPGVAECVVERYFIPHFSLAPQFVGNGIAEQQLISSGIPIKQSFYNRTAKEEAIKKLGLPQNSRIILMMCGSMGCGPIKALTERLPRILPKEAHLVVICGTNRRLYNSITKNGVPDNMTVVGYTTRMPLYMDAASLLLTKPGGLTTSEAIAKRLPMIFINAVPGCETHNLNFFVSRGVAATRQGEDDLCGIVRYMISNPQLLQSISHSIEKEFAGNSCETIYNTICEDLLNETCKLS